MTRFDDWIYTYDPHTLSLDTKLAAALPPVIYTEYKNYKKEMRNITYVVFVSGVLLGYSLNAWVSL